MTSTANERSEVPRTRLDFFQRYSIEHRLAGYRETLIGKARWLKDDMERLIRNLEEGSTINSIGEVQGRGGEIDRLCGLYAEFQRLAEELRAARESEEGA